MANKSHRRYVAPNKRYLQATGASLNDGQENDVSITGHGTGILAKAVGWKHGVAKRSKPVIVGVSKKGDPGAWLNGVQVSLLGIRIPLSIYKPSGVARHVLGVVAIWCDLLLRHVSSLLTRL